MTNPRCAVFVGARRYLIPLLMLLPGGCSILGVAANAMLKAALKEHKSGAMIDLQAEHGNLYDILDTWMNVPEVKRIRGTYCRKRSRANQ